MSKQIETHPFPAILPPHATVMMMGSFPPKAEKRCMEFHYPNFQNDMWRVYGEVFFGRADYFQVPNEKRFDPARIKDFLWQKGIALCPTVRKAIREQDNASDKFLKVVESVNLSEVLPQVPQCHWIFTTGGKATEILLSLLPEKSKHRKPTALSLTLIPIFRSIYIACRPLQGLIHLPLTKKWRPIGHFLKWWDWFKKDLSG